MTSAQSNPDDQRPTRRRFVSWLGMLGGLAASYGLFGAYALRFVFPKSTRGQKAKMFVAFAREVMFGESFYFTTPDGEEYVLTRSDSPTAPLSAYSSRCPHLGCRVHWQGDQKRFYCPCHGGAFDAHGVATAGPPLDANQRLKPCEVMQDGESIYAMVEV